LNPPLRACPCGGTDQKLTVSLIEAAVSAGTSLRPTKSSQFLNLDIARASTIAFDCAGVTLGSLPISISLALLRFVLTVTAAVAAPVVEALGAVIGAVSFGSGVVEGLLS